MKKIGFIALFVSIMMLSVSVVPTIAYAQEPKATDDNAQPDSYRYNEKIDSYELVPLLEKAGENDKFTAWVWIVDRMKDPAICEEVRTRMIAEGTYIEDPDLVPIEWSEDDEKELEETMSKKYPESPWMYDTVKERILERKRQIQRINIGSTNSSRLQKEVYDQENPKIAAALDLKDEDIIIMDTRAPLFIVNLTRSEIERVAESEYVTHIGYSDIYDPVKDLENAPDKEPEEEITFQKGDFDLDGIADSADALAILRGNVESKDFSMLEVLLCDLDEDGILTSYDALLILRRSVGYLD